MDRNRTVARVAFHYQPDESVVLIPVTIPHPIDSTITHRAVVDVLERALHEADKRRALSVSMLPFSEWNSDFNRALLETGFRPAETIQKWQISSPEVLKKQACFPVAAYSELQLHATSLDRNSQARLAFTLVCQNQQRTEPLNAFRMSQVALNELLKTVLNTADDFAGIAPSSAEVMFRFWELVNSEFQVVVAAHHETAVGLMVVNFPNRRQSNKAPRLKREDKDRQQTATEDATVEYIGVVPQHRRSGIASHLIASLPKIDDRQMNFSVFSAEKNSPANALYQSSGFACVDSSVMWIRSEI